MSIEFRQRAIGEYLEMLWRQKLAILLPTLAVSIAVGYVVWRLPSVYESKTSLKINPPAISDRAVQSLTDEDVSQRLNAITEEVKSRTSLEPMITKFSLFEKERASDVPMEMLVEAMRKNITVEIVTKNDEQKATNFTVAYKDRSPDKARAVTAELGSKYIREQQETSIKSSVATREFFGKELGDVKSKLDDIDKRRLSYMMQNVDKLPSQTAGLIAQLEGLRGQEKTIETEIGRMRDNRSYLEREKNNVRDFSEKEATQRQAIMSDVRRTPAYAELIKRKTELEAQLQNLLTQYRPAHPDVKAKQNEIAQVVKELGNMQTQAQTSDAEIRQSTQGGIELRVKNYENEQQRLDSETARQSGILEQVRVQINDVQRRIESIPTAEVALGSFDRDYQTAKQNYDDLLKKKNDADLQAGRDEAYKGEQIAIVDGAFTPQSPVAPKRTMLLGIGVGVGFGIGLLLAFLFEFPRLLTINNSDDAKHYTALPVLAALPELSTVRETRWRRGINFLKITSGLAAAAVSVPILIVILQLSHVFDRFVS